MILLSLNRSKNIKNFVIFWYQQNRFPCDKFEFCLKKSIFYICGLIIYIKFFNFNLMEGVGTIKIIFFKLKKLICNVLTMLIINIKSKCIFFKCVLFLSNKCFSMNLETFKKFLFHKSWACYIEKNKKM